MFTSGGKSGQVRSVEPKEKTGEKTKALWTLNQKYLGKPFWERNHGMTWELTGGESILIVDPSCKGADAPTPWHSSGCLKKKEAGFRLHVPSESKTSDEARD